MSIYVVWVRLLLPCGRLLLSSVVALRKVNLSYSAPGVKGQTRLANGVDRDAKRAHPPKGRSLFVYIRRT